MMRFACALSTHEEVGGLVRELETPILAALDSAPDLAVLFLQGSLADVAEDLVALLREALSPKVLLGVTCESVIGGSREIERKPAVALLAGSLPGVNLQPFHIGLREWRDVLMDEERFQQRVGTGEKHRGQLVLADPFTTPMDALLTCSDTLLRTPTLGGMASGAHSPGGNLLMLNDRCYRDGAIGVGLGGALKLEAVVSQGCRPVGNPMIITKVDENLILELGRRPALEVAQEVMDALPARDLALIQSAGLFIGVAINEYKDEFKRGDFLVRGLMGVDQDSGGLAIGDHARAGQTIQLHVRDAASADEDLRELLAARNGKSTPAGALLFSCNGRGTRMFPTPDHDASVTREVLHGVPLAGFFAMGELGPVGGKSFVHGHTASVALFSEPSNEAR